MCGSAAPSWRPERSLSALKGPFIITSDDGERATRNKLRHSKMTFIMLRRRSRFLPVEGLGVLSYLVCAKPFVCKNEKWTICKHRLFPVALLQFPVAKSTYPGRPRRRLPKRSGWKAQPTQLVVSPAKNDKTISVLIPFTARLPPWLMLH